MKIIASVIGVVAAVILAFTLTPGCVSPPGTTPTSPTNSTPAIYVDSSGDLVVAGLVVEPAAVGNALQIGTELGVSAEVQKDPASAQYFSAAEAVINTAISNGKYDPTTLTNAINLIPVPSGAYGPEEKQIILLAVNTFAGYYAPIAAQDLTDASPYLIPILQGVSNGISTAVTPAVTPTGVKATRETSKLFHSKKA